MSFIKPFGIVKRLYSSSENRKRLFFPQNVQKEKNKNAVMYTFAALIGVFGMTYAAVPLYRLFCQQTGYGGTTKDFNPNSQFGWLLSFFQESKEEKLKKLIPRNERRIKIHFSASVSPSLRWQFEPCQSSVTVRPGETSLIFYKAKYIPSQNSNDPKEMIGVATYNIVPLKAGAYFNKIQCFCFEEQRLREGEDVDMPVFFFLNPSLLEDPNMLDVEEMTLSYTFFKARHGGGYLKMMEQLQQQQQKVENESMVS